MQHIKIYIKRYNFSKLLPQIQQQTFKRHLVKSRCAALQI